MGADPRIKPESCKRPSALESSAAAVAASAHGRGPHPDGGGAEVIVPNADLISEKVTNLTLSNRRIRVEIPVGVPHGTPPDQLSRVLVDVARAHPNVLAVPAPTVLFQSLGDSALQLELRCWADDLDAFLIVRSEVTAAAYRALAEAGIPIAASKRDVRVTMEGPPPPPSGA